MLLKVLRRIKKPSVFILYSEERAKRTDVYTEGWLVPETGQLFDKKPIAPSKTKKKPVEFDLEKELEI